MLCEFISQCKKEECTKCVEEGTTKYFQTGPEDSRLGKFKEIFLAVVFELS